MGKKTYLKLLVHFFKLHPERGTLLFGSVRLHIGVRGCGCLTEAIEGSHAVHHPAADGVVGQRVKHAAQSTGTGRSANQILQDQVPADEKCHKLPNSDIAVGVSRPRGLGDADSEFCIANAYMGQTHMDGGF